MKTSELTGAALDWAVAQCEGVEVRWSAPHEQLLIEGKPYTVWNPHKNWAQGGPIIEREGLTVEYLHDSRWIARHPTAKRHSRPIFGEDPTPLIAAMRCYCCSKLGDEVDVPNELV